MSVRTGAAGATPGRVALVGAGPGARGLMTARALELIAAADVIVHDRLLPDGALDEAREEAELIYAGKVGGGPSTPQGEILDVLIERARQGAMVVRLKGGDPFVFGRGGEEALALRAAGIDFEVVPGVTAGVAGPAYAGIPITHRGRASAVAFVTAHEDPDKPESSLDWSALAAFPGTLVLYMGTRRLEAIAERLLAAGRPGSEPAAVIERGSFPDQRVVYATLATASRRAVEADIGAPAITVVGPVASLGEELTWFAAGPLAGRTVAVTRVRAEASALARELQALGARVVQAPAIRVTPLAGPAPDLAAYDLVCLTSPNGVRYLWQRVRAAGGDARSFAGTTLAAIGAGTARALAEHGLEADVVPARSVAEGLVEALVDHPIRRALVARASEARDVLPDALRERGAEVEVVTLYETKAQALGPAELEAARTADYVTFTSSSTVRYLLEAAGETGFEPSPDARIVSIGPVTSETLRERGLVVHVEAERHDIKGLVAAIVGDAQGD
ncbi:MAG: uroporphyrinogen-III C-methyltransferase [Solirubrobacteraceae bacterium]